ncbi:helix-turn-helix protein [Acinetobacter calcoaceticus]|uniref:Helix-turn-helix protein n=1 Tax=Acinetobacter calcoaceticus TaxID=471 RepID=A0A4V2QZS9_ACICA|nr:helix-turn-helix protein [Acinetobacter calcoaceticus]
MIGSRIKEERTRLGLNQPDFAALANSSKRTLIDWEKEVSSPTAVQMAALAQSGVDVQYVITGLRSSNALPTDETLVLEKYRLADQDVKTNVVLLLLGASNKDSVVSQPTNSSSGTQLNGTNPTVNNGTFPDNQNISDKVRIKSKGKKSQAGFNISNQK